jgi:isopenicillin-N N-acyltransferase like protein
MVPYVSRQADPADRGCAFGRDQADAVRLTVASYERLFAALHGLGSNDLDEIGRGVGERIGRDFPELVAEIAGIARGAGVPEERLIAVNARTEIFAGAAAPECTVVGVGRSRARGGQMLAQNWDWHPDQSGAVVLWTVELPTGGWFTTLTEAGILAKIGINSGGLGLCINMLSSSRDGGTTGMPIHLLLRLILERCGDLAQADELVHEFSYSASTAVSVAHAGEAGDDMGTFELSPAGVATVPTVDGLIFHTNHFLTRLADAEDIYLRDWPDTAARLVEVRLLDQAGDLVGPEVLKSIFSSHQADRISICCHGSENPHYVDRQETLASVLLHLDELRIEVAEGAPCVTSYREVDPDPSSRAHRADSHTP